MLWFADLYSHTNLFLSYKTPMCCPSIYVSYTLIIKHITEKWEFLYVGFLYRKTRKERDGTRKK